MADPLTQAFETIQGRIINIEQGLDQITERIRDIQRNHNQRIGQIERLFTLYKELQIEVEDLKRSTNKNNINHIIDELTEEDKKRKKQKKEKQK